jgi:hypothetical protein
MDIEALMRRLAGAGTTVIVKADHERLAEGGEYWTLVVSGGTLGQDGLVRAEASSLADCLRTGLSRLREKGARWGWVSEFMPNEQPETDSTEVD